jgi:hypothetical protein
MLNHQPCGDKRFVLFELGTVHNQAKLCVNHQVFLRQLPLFPSGTNLCGVKLLNNGDLLRPIVIIQRALPRHLNPKLLRRPARACIDFQNT